VNRRLPTAIITGDGRQAARTAARSRSPGIRRELVEFVGRYD
jgi:hypothetical protein